VLLVVLSAFFSGSEASMMALNRYRLRHLTRQQHRGAMRASRLLERPDRLVGLILLGNSFVNVLAASLSTLIALRLVGEAGVAIAAGLMTLVILIFGEIAPKKLALLHAERIALRAAFVLDPLLRIAYPLVAAIDWIASGVLRPLGVKAGTLAPESPSSKEQRTVVNEAGAMVSWRYQRMLASLLDLEKVTVDDIMVPKSDIKGIDLEDSRQAILEQLASSQHTLLPLYRGDIDDIIGVLHLRKIIEVIRADDFEPPMLEEYADEPYFVPAGTPLNTQLLNFQRNRVRIGLVVDEYGDIEGLVTLEDILEEIVGEFTTDFAGQSADIHRQDDGTYLIDAGITVRELNRALGWGLPTDGPKTLNGLILEHMETIPEPGTSLLLAGYPVEVVQTSESAVRTARVNPARRRPSEGNASAVP
jgi:Mg2+/Co2+ transporter CorB